MQQHYEGSDEESGHALCIRLALKEELSAVLSCLNKAVHVEFRHIVTWSRGSNPEGETGQGAG